MEIKVGGLNEFRFVPDIVDNLEQPKEKRFVIVVKKISNVLNSQNWVSLDENGEGIIDKGKMYLANIVRFENAPFMDDNGKKTVLTSEELTEGKYHVLYDIMDKLAIFINNLGSQGNDETKK